MRTTIRVVPLIFMNKNIFLIALVLLFSCKSKVEKIRPAVESISESIYASGIIKSKHQYQAYASVNGIINEIFVVEGDTILKGAPILSITSDLQRLAKENAELAANYAAVSSYQGKLNEAKLMIELTENKRKNDSALYFRQKALYAQQIGTKNELELRDLAYQNAKLSHFSAVVNYDNLKRQLDFAASQSRKNLMISSKVESDYTLRSEIDGVVYRLNKTLGEIVNPQTALALVGDASNFILEMQVDEYDIFRIRKGLTVMVTLDSYKGKVFEAKVTKIIPQMNERSKTFLVEAEFYLMPEVLYPNITFEANIVIDSKSKALILPRNYLINDSIAVKANGDRVIVKTGLKDYQKIEILSGISAEDELIKPLQ